MKKGLIVVAVALLFVLAVLAEDDSIVSENVTLEIIDNSSDVLTGATTILPIEETFPETTSEQDTVAVLPIETLPEDVSVDETAPEIVTAEPTILQTALTLILDKLSVLRGEIIDLSANLFYENNTPVPGETIHFYAGSEQIASRVTDESGLANFVWNTSPFAPGVYLVTADYSGSGNLRASLDGEEVTITAPLQEPQNSSLQVISLTTAAVISERIQTLEECTETLVEEEQHIIGTCQQEHQDVMECTDEPENTSCQLVTRMFDYPCITGTQLVQNTVRDCRTTGHNVTVGNTTVVLTEDDYVCLPTEDTAEQVTIICDSKFDGNGDGACSSGESCMMIVVTADGLQKLEKNSRNDFVEQDDGYVIPEMPVEVRQ